MSTNCHFTVTFAWGFTCAYNSHYRFKFGLLSLSREMAQPGLGHAPSESSSGPVRVHFINNYPSGPRLWLMQISERALSAASFGNHLANLKLKPGGNRTGPTTLVLNLTSGINLLESEIYSCSENRKVANISVLE